MLGKGKKLAKADLDDAIGKLNKITSKTGPALTNSQARINSNAEVLSNIEKHLPSDVQKAKKQSDSALKFVNTKNQYLQTKKENQNILQNAVDLEQHKGRAEMGKAKLKNIFATKKYDKAVDTAKIDAAKNLSHASAEAGIIKDTLGVTDAEKKVSDAQKAFDKATRATKSARTVATVGTVAGAGLAKKKMDEKNNMPSYY